MMENLNICDSRILIVPDKAHFCIVPGYENQYGLGIRLGTYLIWSSSVLATTFATRSAESVRNINACFQSATFIALLYITASRNTDVQASQVASSFFAFEAYILLVLCFGGILSSLRLPQSTSLKQWKAYIVCGAASPSELLRLALATACSVYGVWLATSGLNDFCQSVCGNYVFFFARVDLYSWYRGFLLAMFSISSVAFAAFLIWSLLTIIRNTRLRWRSWINHGSPDPQCQAVMGVLPLLYGIALLILGIMAVEFPLFWNTVVGVSGTTSIAQLFPVVIGAVCVGRVCVDVSVGLLLAGEGAAEKAK